MTRAYSIGILIGLALLPLLEASIPRAEVEGLAEELDHELVVEARKLEKSFSIINKRLQKKLPESTEAQKNIQVAREMLDNKTRSSFFSSPLLKKALKLFVSLPESLTACDYKSFIILASNYEAVKDRYHGQKSRRVDKIIDEFLRAHSKKCISSYVPEFDRLLATAQQVDHETLDTIEQMFRPALSLVPNRLLYDIPTSKAVSLDETFVFNVVKSIDALNEPNIYEKYIVKPCKRHIEIFKDIFAPARLDRPTLSTKIDLSDNFIRHWLYHRLCLKLSNNDIESSKKQFEAALLNLNK